MLKQVISNTGPDRGWADLPRGLDWGFAAGAVAFLVASIWFLQELTLGLATKNWPSTEGRITQVEQHDSVRGGGTFVPAYEYGVDGKSHTGRGIGYGWPTTRDDFWAHPAKYQRPGPVSVYYDPRDPARSSLWNKGPGLIPWLFAIFSPVGVFLATFTFFVLRRARREARQLPREETSGNLPHLSQPAN